MTKGLLDLKTTINISNIYYLFRSADVEWAGQSGQHNDLLCNSAHLKSLINEVLAQVYKYNSFQTISFSPEASKLALMTRLQTEGENSAVPFQDYCLLRVKHKLF